MNFSIIYLFYFQTAPTKAAEIPEYLQLYQTPPGDDISLTEFDDIAMERLKLLKSFENLKDSVSLYNDEFKDKFRKLCDGTKLIGEELPAKILENLEKLAEKP